MITAVDTRVLVDVFVGDRLFGPRSHEALAACLSEGRVVASEIVWAELSAVFPSATAAAVAMDRLGVDFGPMDRAAALAAGDAWRAYRRRGGRRERVIADFLVGAHALAHADRLLTRDRGFYRAYFTRLKLLEPREA